MLAIFLLKINLMSGKKTTTCDSKIISEKPARNVRLLLTITRLNE